MDYKDIAKKIVKYVGGKENIVNHFHCATRLRLELKDKSQSNLKGLKNLNGVLGVVEKTGQIQIVLGDKVRDVYAEVANLVPLENMNNLPEKQEKKGFSGIMEKMAGIFGPIIPIIAGAGILKTVLTICVQLGWMTEASQNYQILYIAANAVFNFLPIVLAYSAAKTLKTNVIVALTMAASLFYPTILDASAKGVEYMHFFGIPLKVVDSANSVIPILLSVVLLKYVYDFVDKRIPDSLKMFLTSFIVLTIMIPIELIVFAPLGSYLGSILMQGMSVLINASKLISGAIIGALWIPLVVTGMHHAVIPLLFQEIATNGYTILMPATNMANVALAASIVAVFVKTKSKKNKAIAGAATPSCLMGITEPGIYGIMIKYKSSVIGTMIGGAVGGAYIVLMNAVQYFFGGLGVFTPLMNIGNEKFMHHLIATILSFVVSFIVTYIMFKDKKEDDVKDITNTKDEIVYSPVKGKVISLNSINDEVFSKEMMGKGVAIEPTEGIVRAPFDGRISAIAGTKHAIGFTSENGVEVIVHFGLDTVNLKGKYFEVLKNVDDYVNKGEIIVKINIKGLQESGCVLTTPVVVTNTQNYQEVIPLNIGNNIDAEEIIEVRGN